MLARDHVLVGSHHEILDKIRQFSHVPGPFIRAERIYRIFAQPYLAIMLLVVDAEKVKKQEGYVFSPFP